MLITGVVITMNEADHIAATLESLARVCDHLVVLDSLSSDNTVEIARSCGALVHLQEYAGDGPQKNSVIDLAPTDWILILDADEWLDEDAVCAINAMKDSDAFDNSVCYTLRRKNFIGSRWVRHCGWYPDQVTRLFNRKYHRYEGKIHATVQSNRYLAISGHIVHNTFNDYVELFAKANYYSTSTAVIAVNQGRRVLPWAPVVHGLAAFIRIYFLRRGFLSGVDGLVIAVSGALNSFLKYAKARELKKHGSTRSYQWWATRLFNSEKDQSTHNKGEG